MPSTTTPIAVIHSTVLRSGRTTVERRKGRTRGEPDGRDTAEVGGGGDSAPIADMAELTERAAGGTEQRRKSLVGSEDLLCTVRVEDCVFESGDLQRALDGSPTDQLHELEGDVMIEDTAKHAGLRLRMHKDGLGCTSYVDRRVMSWATRGGRSDESDGAAPDEASAPVQAMSAHSVPRNSDTGIVPRRGGGRGWASAPTRVDFCPPAFISVSAAENQAVAAPTWELDLSGGRENHSNLPSPAEEAGVWELSLDSRVEPVKTPLNQEKHNDLPPAATVSVPTGAFRKPRSALTLHDRLQEPKQWISGAMQPKTVTAAAKSEC